MTDKTRIPTRSARLVRPPDLGLDGTPLRIHGKAPEDRAAAAIEDARVALREAFDAFSAAGLHHQAQDVTTALDAVDALRAGLVRS